MTKKKKKRKGHMWSTLGLNSTFRGFQEQCTQAYFVYRGNEKGQKGRRGKKVRSKSQGHKDASANIGHWTILNCEVYSNRNVWLACTLTVHFNTMWLINHWGDKVWTVTPTSLPLGTLATSSHLIHGQKNWVRCERNKGREEKKSAKL